MKTKKQKKKTRKKKEKEKIKKEEGTLTEMRKYGVPVMAQRKRIQLGTVRLRV